jgi:hypothetical protein
VKAELAGPCHAGYPEAPHFGGRLGDVAGR